MGGLVNDGDDIYADWTVDFATGDPVMNRRYLAGVSFADVPLPQEGPAYFHADHLGTTRRLSQAGGSPPVRESIYTAFGELKHSAGSLTTRYGYVGASGYEESPAGGPADVEFIHVGARWYDPATGRFLQRDPIGSDGGVNVYAYAQNDPLASIDPDGLLARNPLRRENFDSGLRRQRYPEREEGAYDEGPYQDSDGSFPGIRPYGGSIREGRTITDPRYDPRGRGSTWRNPRNGRFVPAPRWYWRAFRWGSRALDVLYCTTLTDTPDPDPRMFDPRFYPRW